jgi:phosphoribosylformylglycinamidine cyclo-ligase
VTPELVNPEPPRGSGYGPEGLTYRSAGVDIDAADQLKRRLAARLRELFTGLPARSFGQFAGLYPLPGLPDKILAATVDGVGTKTRIAALLGKFDGLGRDLVHHCVNDLATCGAEPLFMLDYYGTGRLDPEAAEAVVLGVAAACRDWGITLLGGETAEMPGIYVEGEFDLVGCLVGMVDRDSLITGADIGPGDVILGLPSDGLHTNGYSLVRKVFGLDLAGATGTLNRHYSELGQTLGEALLRPHRCYLNEVRRVRRLIKGVAHITGGGIPGNVARVIPESATAVIRVSWEIPPIFRLIAATGRVAQAEMFRVFNMGVGLVFITDPDRAPAVLAELPEAFPMGEVVRAEGDERVKLLLD